MLKGVPSILNPELLKIMMEMGHGDELVIGDGNFPSASCAKRLVRCDGHGIPELLEAILQFFPLDHYVDAPVFLMGLKSDADNEPAIWGKYREIVKKYESKPIKFETVERFSFYDRAKNAYAIVTSGDKTLRANIILKKGVIQ